MVMSVPNSEHGPLPTTLVIRRLWGSPDVTYGRPSEMERENTETSWSPPTLAPTPDACGVACGTSLAIKGEIAVMISLLPHYLMTSTPPPKPAKHHSLMSLTAFMHASTGTPRRRPSKL